MRALAFTLIASAASIPAQAAEKAKETPPTFYRDVLPILQDNCQECHRTAGANYGGMVAPMSLTTFEEVRPWVKSIVKQVDAGLMPPWHAAETHRGQFSNERSLTDDEKATLLTWASTGAARGNADDAPPPREFPATNGWSIGEPDLVVAMPEPYVVGDDVDDQYTAFTVDLTDAMLPEDAWITAFQCKPGSKIIHHFNCHLLYPNDDGKLPPPPTAPESNTVRPEGAGLYIGGVSSGTDANIYPEGFGLLLKKGTRVTFDIHYHKEPGSGTAVTDLSQIGFKLSKTPPKRVLGGAPPLMRFDIKIAPGDSRYQLGPVAYTLQKPVDVISLMPHMHMRGTEATFEFIYPDGTRETALHVPQYDFNWQTVYYYNEMKRLPAGTRLEFTAWYDNSPEMAAKRGFDAGKTVTYGEKSTDEMMMGFVMASVAEDVVE